jgi:FxsC-like protein
MSNYWFFLSYARRNDISYTGTSEGSTPKLVRRLYEELSAEIINGADTGDAKSAEQIGFFDQTGIEPGDKWDNKVAQALTSARVMLCLFTRNYFNSTVSGQEMEVFRSRVESYANAKGIAHPPLIIPILWHGPDRIPKPLPSVVSSLQYTYDEFSKVYAKEGLEFLMRLEKHHDDYQEFLIKLARRLIDVAEEHPLTPMAVCPPLKTVKNAFAPATQIAPVGAPAAPAASTASTLTNCGPGFAHFVFVAGQRQELQGVRNVLAAYDQEGRLWKPYLPAVDRPVALFTQRAATDAELQHEVLPLSKVLMDQLDIADDTNTIVVLIVDPWTLNVQSYQDYMKTYDKRNLVSCAVIIVWNPDDQQDVLTPQQLQQKVRETFKNSLTNQNLYVRETTGSATNLNSELISAIIEIRRRLDMRAKLFRPVDPAGFAAIPQVATPSGAPSGNTP